MWLGFPLPRCRRPSQTPLPCRTGERMLFQQVTVEQGKAGAAEGAGNRADGPGHEAGGRDAGEVEAGQEERTG